MKPEPVRHVRAPRYPTRREVLRDPAILEAAVPPAWRRACGAGAALGTLLAWSGAGCREADRPAPGPGGPGAAMVAPVFERGDGSGATGCVVVVPPVFLSEEEALRVIREELASAGIDLGARDVPIEGASDRLPGGAPPDGAGATGPAGTYLADLGDPTRGIAVEFISSEDDLRRQLSDIGKGWSSVTSYDLQDEARQLADRMRPVRPGVRFGTFYDPVSYDHATAYGRADEAMDATDALSGEEAVAAKLRVYRDLHAATERARVRSKRLLRLQVRDFVDWLRGQGAI